MQAAAVVSRDCARLNSDRWSAAQIEKALRPGLDPRENYKNNTNTWRDPREINSNGNSGKDPRQHKSTNGKDPRENNSSNNNNNDDNKVLTSGCLVVSGALDGTLCVFRANFGVGLRLLRRLNLACPSEGLPGALLAGFPDDGGGSGRGDILEVGRRDEGKG